jgi:hypothetical protein
MLQCDTCPASFHDRGTPERTDEYARVAGWHIYRGPSIVDSLVKLVKVLCPECMGTPRSRVPIPETLSGQLDIGFDIPQVQKFKRKPREDVN